MLSRSFVFAVSREGPCAFGRRHGTKPSVISSFRPINPLLKGLRIDPLFATLKDKWPILFWHDLHFFGCVLIPFFLLVSSSLVKLSHPGWGPLEGTAFTPSLPICPGGFFWDEFYGSHLHFKRLASSDCSLPPDGPDLVGERLLQIRVRFRGISLDYM